MVAGSLASFASVAAAQDESPRDIVLRLAPGADIAEVCDRYGMALVSEMSERGLFRVRPAATDPGELVCFILDGDDSIITAEPDGVAEVVSGNTQSFFFRLYGEYTDQPALTRMGFHSIGIGPDGAGVTVAILDTGYFDHPAISAAIMPGYNFVDGTHDTFDLGVGHDTNANGIADEMAGHGTFVAGLVSLIAPHVNLLPIKVLDSDGMGSVYTVAAGIYYAADHGADIINLSLSVPSESQVISDAIIYAREHGAVVVAAVGNSSSNAPVYPAAGAGVLAVSATTMQNTKAWFSDFGSHVDVCAPGVDVVSTLPNGMFGVGSGTSFATAFVSGTAALVHGTMTSPTPDAVTARIKRTATKVTATMVEYPGQMGSGRLNIGAALANKPGKATALEAPEQPK